MGAAEHLFSRARHSLGPQTWEREGTPPGGRPEVEGQSTQRRQGRRVVHFVMASRSSKTGGSRYNLVCLDALEAAGVTVKHIWLSPYLSLSLLGLIPRWGKLLCSPFVAIALAWRRGLFVVDENYLEAMWVTNWLRKKFGLGTLVVIVHHMDRYSSAPRAGDWSAAYQRWLLESADRIIAVSQYTRSELLSLDLEPERVVVVSTGFEPRPVLPPVPGGTALRCLAVGRSSHRKGWDTLVSALAQLPPGMAECKFVGDYKTVFHQRVVKPLLKEVDPGGVRFLGWLDEDELEEQFAQTDLVVYPSRQEGFGIVVVEAFHRGIPVLASDTSAIPELVEHGHNGWLIPPADPQALAEALELLATERSLLTRMRDQGRETAALYSWSRTGAGFLEAVGGLLERY